jgi:hypothetical protein
MSYREDLEYAYQQISELTEKNIQLEKQLEFIDPEDELGMINTINPEKSVLKRFRNSVKKIILIIVGDNSRDFCFNISLLIIFLVFVATVTVSLLTL